MARGYIFDAIFSRFMGHQTPLKTARATAAFRFHPDIHLYKEDTHLYRIFRERIPMPEQGKAVGIGHLPSLMILFGLGSPLEIPAAFLAEVLLLNGVLSLIAAWYFRKSGFLAAVGVHFWADIVWHVVFGAL
jgi:hypothetical protein